MEADNYHTHQCMVRNFTSPNTGRWLQYLVISCTQPLVANWSPRVKAHQVIKPIPTRADNYHIDARRKVSQQDGGRASPSQNMAGREPLAYCYNLPRPITGEASVQSGQISESKGLVSIDRSKAAALLSTTPRLKPRSSTNDLAPLHCMGWVSLRHTGARLSSPRRAVLLWLNH